MSTAWIVRPTHGGLSQAGALTVARKGSWERAICGVSSAYLESHLATISRFEYVLFIVVWPAFNGEGV